ncbi:MAG: DNA adenine methylase, partial [Candidatus Latescibacteria bacterium]|nr:DNA adenine methylase [Candidatus Latescibacterota bacterium]
HNPYFGPRPSGCAVNYIGSKYSLLEFLERGILGRVRANGQVFLDVFAGTGIVGWHFKQRGFRVVANDVQYYAYCRCRALVGIDRPPEFAGIVNELALDATDGAQSDPVEALLTYLNALGGEDGFVYRTYCPGGTRGSAFERQYFCDENGRRCDAIRTRIEVWREQAWVTEDEYYYMLASLIDAADRVANTASVYGAFLKHIKKSAQRPLRLGRLPVVGGRGRNVIHNCDGGELVGEVACDVLYMDPPYNQRQYCANYHVLETIARYDRPEVHGITGLRDSGDQKSDFCVKRRVLPAFERMVDRTSARHVFLSYNSEGLMQKDDILDVMGRYGQVELLTQDYGRFRADVDRENRVYKADRVEEYLFCLDKG